MNDDAEIVIVSRSKGKSVVVMSLEEYNSINETLYLANSTANKKRLDKVLIEMEQGTFLSNELKD